MNGFIEYLLERSTDLITISVGGFFLVLAIYGISVMLPERGLLRVIFVAVAGLAVMATIVGVAFWYFGRKIMEAVS